VVSMKCLEKSIILMLGVYAVGIKFERLEPLVYLVLKATPELVDVVCGDEK